jgi:hypothetical protein
MWDNLISLSFREKKKRQIVKYLLFGSQISTSTLDPTTLESLFGDINVSSQEHSSQIEKYLE